MSKKLSLLFGGDTYVGEDSTKYFEGVTELLKSADVRMLQLEKPYLKELIPGATEDRLVSVLDPMLGNVDLVTLAGNHFYDFGEAGVRDTIEWCHDNGIECCGGGSTLEEAEKPAFIEKDGVKIGVLAMNAVGPKRSFATETKGGTSYINFIRAYIPTSEVGQLDNKLENDLHSVPKPCHMEDDFAAFNLVDVDAYVKYAKQVAEAKAQCDILIAYFHKGYVHTPVTVSAYERLLSHLAIDSGADAVMGSHSHILRGIEVYKGKAIYHGLNNFVVWAPYLSAAYKGKVSDTADFIYSEWIQKRAERFGFVPDPDYPTYPFLPDSVYTMTAKLVIEDKKIVSHRLIPMKVEKSGVPYVHGSTEVGREILAYIEKITREADLNAKFEWDGDEVVIS